MSKNIVVEELELLMEYGKVFTSFNVTKELKFNGHLVIHDEVAKEVRKQFCEGLMDDFDYDVVVAKNNVMLNDSLYTAAIYYPKGFNFSLPFKAGEIGLSKQNKIYGSCCSTGKVKRCGDEGMCGSVARSDHTHSVGELKSLSSKVQELKKQIEEKYCVVEKRIIETKSDGRLEIPQDLLKKHFNGNVSFMFIKRDDSSFYVSLPTNNILAKPIYGFDCFDGRVRIPKTVFNMLKLPTDQYSEYSIHYNPKVNSFVVESND
jgi:hypothetical protein